MIIFGCAISANIPEADDRSVGGNFVFISFKNREQLCFHQYQSMVELIYITVFLTSTIWKHVNMCGLC